MDFELGEEERLLRDTVRGLGQQRIRPHAERWDEARALPPDLLAELGALGLLGLSVAEEAGGTGLSAVAGSALCEELAAADGGLAQLLVAHNHLGLAHVMQGLSAEEAVTEAPALVSGERLVVWALPPEAMADGVDPAWLVRARRDGDDWVLEGEVAYGLGVGVADRLVVFGQTDQGPTAWLCDAQAPGLVREPVRTLGARAMGTAHLRLEGVRVSQARRLGEPGQALHDARALVPRAHIGLAAVACGLLRGALEVAAAYALEREQFGRPIARFQAIQWKLADMSTALDAAWLLTMQAAWRYDQGLPHAQAAARARVYAATAATRGCSEALQIHGGYGYTREFPVERSLRDARQCEGRAGPALRLWLGEAIAARFAG